MASEHRRDPQLLPRPRDPHGDVEEHQRRTHGDLPSLAGELAARGDHEAAIAAMINEAQQWGTATWLVPFTPASQEVKLLELRVAPPDPGYSDRLLLAAVRHPWLSLSGVLPLVAATALLLGLWVTCTLMLLAGLLVIVVLVLALGRLRSCPAERLPADADFALRRLRNARSDQDARAAHLALWDALSDQNTAERAQ